MSVLEFRLVFSLMGEVLEAQTGCVAVDVGSKCIPGVIDHHFAGLSDECAASLIVRQPELVLDHLGRRPHDEVTVRMHREPDLDCVVAAYFVRELVQRGSYRPDPMCLRAMHETSIADCHPPMAWGPLRCGGSTLRQRFSPAVDSRLRHRPSPWTSQTVSARRRSSKSGWLEGSSCWTGF